MREEAANTRIASILGLRAELHVVIPHSEPTMPTLAEQVALLAQRNLPPDN
jgi:hypothetical protein